jgi:hypothetical protein
VTDVLFVTRETPETFYISSDGLGQSVNTRETVEVENDV